MSEWDLSTVLLRAYPCLLLLGLIAPLSATAVAQSDEGFGDERLVALEHPVFVLVPTVGAVKAGSEVTLWALLVDTDGLPFDKDLAISVKADDGRIERFEQRRPGVYQIRFLAPSEGETARIEFRAVVGGVPIEQTFDIPVRLSGKSRLSLSLRASTMRLGVDRQVPFVVRGVGSDGSPIQAEDLTVRINVGKVERLRTIRPGQVEGVFVPEGIKTPMCAILAVFQGQGEDHVVAWRTIRLVGKPRIPVRTEPGSMAWVDVGKKRFGPVEVGQSGQVHIPVEVPPGVDSVLVTSRDAAGNATRYRVNLSIPPFPRALLHIDREAYRVDETSPLVVTLLLVKRDGSPSPLVQTTMSASGGHLGGLVEVGPGTFRSLYTPPQEPGHHEIKVTVPLEDGTEQVYAAAVDVKVGIPARVDLSVNPPSMRADDPPAQVSLKVYDKAGNPTSGISPRAEVDFGTVGTFRAIGPGEYVAPYRAQQTLDAALKDPSGMVRAQIRAWVDRKAGDGPAVELALSPRSLVVDGGGAPVRVDVTALDRWGAPVRDVPVTVVVEQGDGRVTGPDKTGEGGHAVFLYHPGVHLGPVVLCARSEKAGLEARTLVLQAGPGAVDPGFLDLLAGLQVSPGMVLSATTDVVVRAGLVKRIQISAIPSQVYAGRGQSSQLRIRLEDHLGNAVVDPFLQVEAALGKVSDVEFSSDGVYTARYTPPAITRAAVIDVVHATNPDGEYSGSTEIQVFREEGRILTALRLGYVSNLAAFSSPVVDLEGMARVPRFRPTVYAGAAISYYSFTAEGATSVRYDLFPLHLFAVVRSQTGRFAPYGGAGPVVGLALVGAPIPASFFGDSGDDGSASAEPDSEQWRVARAFGVFPGFRALLGLEVGMGPGGLSLEGSISWLRGGSALDDMVGQVNNLGGIMLRGGYVAHF